MPENMLIVDHSKCSGCRTCEMACSLHKENKCSPRLSRNRVIRYDSKGINVPTTCAHCSKPYCMLVCPVKAISENSETGALIIDENTCVGCRACIVVCPLGQVNYHMERKVAVKCDLCDGSPVCSEFCPTGAISYGYVDDSLMEKRRDSFAKFIVEEGSA